MKATRHILIIFTLLLISSTYTFSQVVINEYSCSNLNTITDNYGEYEDWIELYNTSASSVSLAGFYLSDRITNPMKWQIPAGVSIAPNDFLMVFANKRSEFTGGYLHTSFKLTQTKLEHIVLSDPSGNIMDVVQTIPTQDDHSRGRTTNGSTTWALFTTPTPNANNAGPKQNYAFTPQFSLEAGSYPGAISVSITSPDPGVSIYYTTDGTEPLTTSTPVTSPISVTLTTVIRARAFSSNTDIPASFIETNTYFINTPHTLPVISISGTEVGNLLGGSGGQRVGVFEYFNADEELLDEATGYFNKHGNDSWAYAQRGFDFVARDEMGYNHAIRHQIFRDSDRDEFQRLIVKAAANDNYPFATSGSAHIRDAYVHTLCLQGNLEMDERTYEPCILYLNGAYWGVYDIREKADDHDYTDYYYNQDEFDIQYLKTWGGTWTEYGAPDAAPAWQTLKNFITTNDMSIPANYAAVDSQYNCLSLIDYVVLNSYVVCSDWLNWNTAWWRGLKPSGEAKKWRYVLWDEDATFGHYINYTGVPNTTPAADPCNPEALGDPGNQGHIPVLNALMANPTFYQLYVSRFVDLSNTVFSCDYMQHLLDSLIDLIEPEMPKQIVKWGGTMAQWQANVQEMKDFIDQRCVDLDSGMVDCYDLTGPFDIKVDIDPPDGGEVKINSLWFDQFPYYGSYFGEINILLEAKPGGNYVFDHWEFLHHTAYDGETAENLAINLLSTDTIVAVFKNPTPKVYLGEDTVICEGTSIVLNAGNPGLSFQWQDGSQQQTYTVNAAGTYSVEVTNLGFTDVDSIVISTMTGPWVSLSDDTQICPNEIITLHAESDAEEIVWQDGSIGVSYQANEPGFYWVEVANKCGTANDSMELYGGVGPEVNLGPDFIIEIGESQILDAEAPNSTYLWHDYSTSPYFTVTEPGIYWVIVTNSCGSKFDEVIVRSEIEVIVPNAFSPNGDGINDEFFVIARGIYPESFEILVFDRWGNMAFEGHSLYESWDGRINGQLIRETGVFTYILNYTRFDGEKVKQSGTILVLL
ncbi:MAG: CotH kinase family protein [Bacteroidales bacterium]|nr:CotH kinase family protein [Bacteroidales bacterium]MCF8458693.1 CotH kinase family protein [Bacteroidales bacterium]